MLKIILLITFILIFDININRPCKKLKENNTGTFYPNGVKLKHFYS